MAKVIEIHIPEYDFKNTLDYAKIGPKVDQLILSNFPNGRYLFRAVGMVDHPNLTINEFASIILKLGYDKYDPKRKSVRHDEFSRYDYDIQVEGFEIRDSKIILDEFFKHNSLFGECTYNFRVGAPQDRGYPVRIDLLLIYDAKKLVKARRKPGAKAIEPGLVNYLYKFKSSQHKADALLGIIKILR